jgi:hypothetical protein
MDDGIRTGLRFGLTLSLHSASGIALAHIERVYCNNPLPIMSSLVTKLAQIHILLEGSSSFTFLALTRMEVEERQWLGIVQQGIRR